MNPVMSRLHSEIKKTPQGFPTMPGYTPARMEQPHDAMNAYPYQDSLPSSHSPYSSLPEENVPVDMTGYEDKYASRSADAIDRGHVTMDDIIVKTTFLFLTTCVFAAISWFAVDVNVSIASALALIGAFGGLVFALINSFKKVVSPVLTILYAVCEGLFLGALSAGFERLYPGIVVQAVIATLIVFAVTLALYKMRVIRETPRLRRFTLIGLVSVMIFFVVSWVYTLVSGSSVESITLFGLPLGLIIGVVCIVLGVTSLVSDFSIAEEAVYRGMPRRFAWACSFGIMVTLIWLYINILRVLAYISEMQR